MAILERAVSDLADALDALEGKINDRLSGDETNAHSAVAVARHARTAREKTEEASDALSAAIGDLKSLLQEEDG